MHFDDCLADGETETETFAPHFKLLEGIEATANLVIGKDMILYGHKRGVGASSPDGHMATAVPASER